jgi:hypothetical protein
VGQTLEEQAVGVNMATFQNIPSVFKTPAFNQFRVIITRPDATTGATTFCGVVRVFLFASHRWTVVDWLVVYLDDPRPVDDG